MAWVNKVGKDGAIATQERLVAQAAWRGLCLSCPNCGQGRLFTRFTSVAAQCAVCHEELSHQRADDAPPYVVIFIVGHILVAGALALEKSFQPPLWLHFSLWLPLALIATLILLPPIKGAIIGLQWANRMHGFGSAEAHHD